MLAFIVVSFLSTYPSSAAPVQNTSPLNAPASNTEIASSWVSEPSGRGTWNILYSCIFTLVLCVWTSVHLNVPGFEDGPWINIRRKVKWVVVALLAPEYVVFTAFQQWFAAKTFLNELQKLHEAKSKDVEVSLGS